MLFRQSCFLFCLFMLAGCGGSPDGPVRYHVSGNVTFDGKPVPTGQIYFETSHGPPGAAQITNGNYDTSSGKGVIGGMHSIVIQGYDGQGTNPGEMGKPLFKPFRQELDLPKKRSQQDFEIPASAAQGLVIENDPA